MQGIAAYCRFEEAGEQVAVPQSSPWDVQATQAEGPFLQLAPSDHLRISSVATSPTSIANELDETAVICNAQGMVLHARTPAQITENNHLNGAFPIRRISRRRQK